MKIFTRTWLHVQKDLSSNSPLVLKSALLKHSLCILILKVQNNSFISSYFLFMLICFVQRNIFNILSFWSDCIPPKKCAHHRIADKSSVVWCLTETLQIIGWHVVMPILDVASDWSLPSSKLSLPEVALKMLFSPLSACAGIFFEFCLISLAISALTTLLVPQKS